MLRYTQVSGAFFGVLAAVHLARVIFGWPAQVAGMAIPVWTSGVAFVIASGFAYWASRSTKGAA